MASLNLIMEQSEYIKNRVDNQINWMESKSRSNQQRYKILKIVEIVSAALIPFLIGFHNVHNIFPILTGLLGVLIVLLNGIQQLYKYQEKWIIYRTTIEALSREKMLFVNRAAIYTDENAFQRFVENIEALLANENKVWLNTVKQKTEQAN